MINLGVSKHTERVVILKGRVYEKNNKIYIAKETTCSISKDRFDAFCIGTKGAIVYEQDKEVIGHSFYVFIEGIKEYTK